MWSVMISNSSSRECCRAECASRLVMAPAPGCTSSTSRLLLPTSRRSATRSCSSSRNSNESQAWQSKWNEFWKACQFESWAPRSSRAWRLREIPSEVELKGEVLSTADVAAFAAKAEEETETGMVGRARGGVE